MMLLGRSAAPPAAFAAAMVVVALVAAAGVAALPAQPNKLVLRTPISEASPRPNWGYSWDVFPSFSLWANETSFPTREIVDLAGRHALTGWGWQQALVRANFRWVESNIAQAIAYVKALHPETTLYSYRIPQSCFPMFELCRELTDPASRGDEYARSLFMQDESGKICGLGAYEEGVSLMFNWSNPAVLDVWMNQMIPQMDAESGQSAVFFDDTDWTYCAKLSGLSNCSDASDLEMRREQIGAWKGLAVMSKKMNDDGIVPLVSSLNAFSEHLLPPGPKSDFGTCALPEEGLLSAMHGVTWIRYYEFWVSGSPADDAKQIANAMTEVGGNAPFQSGAPIGFIGRQILDTRDNASSVDYGIASFLIAQSEYSYFGVSTGWEDCNWQWWPQYDQPCGAPKGLGQRTGDFTFEREFERCYVSVDTKAKIGLIERDWKKKKAALL